MMIATTTLWIAIAAPPADVCYQKATKVAVLDVVAKDAPGCKWNLEPGQSVAPQPAAPTTGPVTKAAAGGCPAGMALLPAGSFTMGQRGDAVTVDSYCMDVTEVTVDAYAACVKTGKCTQAHTDDNTCNWGKPGRGNQPINCVGPGRMHSRART